jgi:chitodextrinase
MVDDSGVKQSPIRFVTRGVIPVFACALFLVASPGVRAQTSPPTQGLLGYWNFDENTGTIAHDNSGNGYNGAVTDATWVPGKINSALLFNGTSSAVVTPDIPIGSTFSVSAWVNPGTIPQGIYKRIMETQFNGGLYLGTNANGTQFQFIVNGGSGTTGTCGISFGCAEGGTITTGWQLVTATFNGATATLYVNGAAVGSDTFTAPPNTNYPLYIGRWYGGAAYGWDGVIDEVRLYNRALTSAEVSAIYTYTGTTTTTPPTVPGNVTATAISSTTINVTWTASTDSVALAGYQVYRNGTLVGTPTGLSYTDTGLAPLTAYSYAVAAYDTAGNTSAQSAAVSATTLPPDTTPPTVSVTAPTANATLSGTVTVSATATDNVGVASVQFQLDGSNLGAVLTTAPYSIAWNTTTASNGAHTLTAIAQDTSGNIATSTGVTVTVSNAAGTPPTSGLLGYWNFDEDTGTVAHDSSGNGYNGTVFGATWAPGKIGSALSFNGTTNYVVTGNIAFANAFSISAWVNAAVTPQTAFGRIAETQYNEGLYLGVNASGTSYKFIVNGAAGATGTCGAAYGCAEGGTVTSGWHLVTATYSGTTAILYVDQAQVATETFTAPADLSLPLYIGRYYGGSGNGWNGVLDEVRLYNRALTSTEISAIYNYTGNTTPPTVPGNVTATAVSPTAINVTWTASTDSVALASYQVYRNGTLVGTPTGLSYTDTGLAPSTTYSYTVAAYDTAGNASAQSAAASATTLANTTPPTVSITAPAANSILSGTVTVSATATDNAGIASVQFQLDGSSLGTALTTAPYSINWNTTTASNGSHTLTAIAQDMSGNIATSTGVAVTVSNAPITPPTSGLLGYWDFNEDTGTVVHDSSGNENNGTVFGAAWAPGKIGSALSFNGTTNYVVTGNIAFANAFSISAWVNAAVTPQTAFGRIAETQYNEGLYLGVNASGMSYKFIVNGAVGATGTCGAAYGCAEGGTVTSGWHLVTATYNGTTAILYVDQTQVATETFTAPANISLPLYIGRYYGGSGNGWNGVLDEVRLFSRALTSTEVSTIYNYTGDTVPPTAPGNVTATVVSPTAINVTWTASADNVGVAGYQVYRNGILVGTPDGLSYADTGLASSTTYSYTVTAYDTAGNVSAQSAAAQVTTQAPAISIVSANFVTPTGVTVTWSTNEPANSQLVYGLTNAYGSGPITSGNMTTTHAITLSELTVSTTYHFQVQSVDATGNVALSADNVFTTAPTPSWPAGWTQLPNTMMQSVCPPNFFDGENYSFNDECWRLLVWGGGIADTLRNRLLIWGGGHDNYYGNEIYSLNLNANPVTLTRLNNPGPIVTPEGNNCPSALADGSPNARETQNNIAYIANLDLMFSFNGGLACEPGSHLNDTWILNTANLQWQAMDPVNAPFNENTVGPYFAISGYDPSNQTVFTEWSDSFYTYTLANNTYTMLNGAGDAHLPTLATGVVDPKRQLFIAMGTEYQSTAPQIYAIDLTGAGSYSSVDWTTQVTGCNGLASAQYPGLVYDYALDRIVGYPNQGNTVYIFDPDTKTCTTQTYANGPQNTPDSNTQGTFGRFQYFPALDAFAIVNGADDNAYLLRLAPTIEVSSGSGQSANVNTAFASPLVALVQDAQGNLLNGVPVTFTAPASGAGGTFAGGLTSVAVTTVSGLATAPAFTANTVAGTYMVTASSTGVAAQTCFALTNAAVVAADRPRNVAAGAALTTLLQATTIDAYANPLAGATVTSTARTNRASASFADGVGTAVTKSQGMATRRVFSATKRGLQTTAPSTQFASP